MSDTTVIIHSRVLNLGARMIYLKTGQTELELPESLNCKVPAPLYKKSRRYEQHEYPQLALVLPAIFSPAFVNEQHSFYQRNRPDIYRALTGITVIPTAFASLTANEERFFKEHRTHFIEVECWIGGQVPNVEVGKVLVKVNLGDSEFPDSKERYVLVTKQFYESRKTFYGAWFKPEEVVLLERAGV